jgi:hypothetical protein
MKGRGNGDKYKKKLFRDALDKSDRKKLLTNERFDFHKVSICPY